MWSLSLIGIEIAFEQHFLIIAAHFKLMGQGWKQSLIGLEHIFVVTSGPASAILHAKNTQLPSSDLTFNKPSLPFCDP